MCLSWDDGRLHCTACLSLGALMQAVLRLVALFAVGAVLAAPASAARWYENFENAQRSLKKGGSCTDALSLLQLAAAERPEPDAKARTVSMMVIQYDPYYWMAMAHKACGNMSEARAALARARAAGVTEKAQLDLLEASLPAQMAAVATPTPAPAPVVIPTPAPTPVPTNDLVALAAGPIRISGFPAGASLEVGARRAKVAGRDLTPPPGFWQVTFQRSSSSVQGDPAADPDAAWARLEAWVKAGAALSCDGSAGDADIVLVAGCLLLAPTGRVSVDFERAAAERLEAIAAIRSFRHLEELNRLLVRLQARRESDSLGASL